MSKAYPEHLQAMIDRAGTLTADEVEALGRLWKADEEIVFSQPDFALGINGGATIPEVTNEQLLAAWQNALDAAGNAGRVDEIEAAQDAGRAAKRDIRHLHDDELAKDGAEEAVRAAVLAVGVQDLISEEDFLTLTGAWAQVLGEIAR
ncbi:hypothetical protein [Curtobacterium ammoniigenes]|uniref:hypothetical protein n=1 Tax=Curtobacterium ammoniigenes TaxID=395387 RepID=UPI00082DEDA5|nr:hypothetical protein [Curtobacterium ammoniigenes]